MGRESSSHWRAAASQLVTFTSRRAGILAGRQELLIWGTTLFLRWSKARQAAHRNLKLDPKLGPKLQTPDHAIRFGGGGQQEAPPVGDMPVC